jgi:hypothetical protein
LSQPPNSLGRHGLWPRSGDRKEKQAPYEAFQIFWR